jgi:hypothetical protein
MGNKQMNCEYCYQGITKNEPLLKIYSFCKLNNKIMCRHCLTDKERRINFACLHNNYNCDYGGCGWATNPRLYTDGNINPVGKTLTNKL